MTACCPGCGLLNPNVSDSCDEPINIATGLAELRVFFQCFPWRRLALFVALILVILAGLALRRYGYGLHLPFILVKYGASAIWGAMVYVLLAFFAIEAKSAKIALTAMLVSIVVELFRLYHAPWLDAFRLTTAGALLLGRLFSLWNIVSYAIGIATAYWLDSQRPHDNVS